MLQLFFAALFVVAGMSAFLIVALLLYGLQPMPGWVGLVFIAWVILLFTVMLRVFSRYGSDPSREFAKLLEKNLLYSNTFYARRAFVVRWEDEQNGDGNAVQSYFIELANGEVLFLNAAGGNGFGEESAEAEVSRQSAATKSRQFPSFKFTIWRHTKLDHIVRVENEGETFAPEAIFVFPPGDTTAEKLGLRNGQILIGNKSYDDWKRQFQPSPSTAAA